MQGVQFDHWLRNKIPQGQKVKKKKLLHYGKKKMDRQSLFDQIKKKGFLDSW